MKTLILVKIVEKQHVSCDITVTGSEQQISTRRSSILFLFRLKLSTKVGQITESTIIGTLVAAGLFSEICKNQSAVAAAVFIIWNSLRPWALVWQFICKQWTQHLCSLLNNWRECRSARLIIQLVIQMTYLLKQMSHFRQEQTQNYLLYSFLCVCQCVCVQNPIFKKKMMAKK